MKRRKINNIGKSSTFDSREKSFHTVPCKVCDRAMIIDKKYDTGVCWVCVVRLTEPPEEKEEKPKRVRGWQFMEIWVDEDGTVFEKGKENEKLKGKYEPSDIKKIQEERKKAKLLKQEQTKKKVTKKKISSDEKRIIQTEIKKLKDEFKQETRKTYKQKLKIKIKKLQKSLN